MLATLGKAYVMASLSVRMQVVMAIVDIQRVDSRAKTVRIRTDTPHWIHRDSDAEGSSSITSLKLEQRQGYKLWST